MADSVLPPLKCSTHNRARLPEEDRMGRKHHKPEEIVAKLRQVEVLTGQGRSIAEAARSIEVSEQTYFRWRAENGAGGLPPLK